MFLEEKRSLLEKMEKLSKEAYANPSVVDYYEDRYIKHPFVKDEISQEINLIEKLCESKNIESWCDVACGTAYHLRNAKVSSTRTGVDLSTTMIDKHKEETDYEVNYIIEDVLKLPTDKKYDLVTNFWFGYTHQDTLDEVLLFFKKMAELTNKGGSVVLSFHDQWHLSEKYPYESPCNGFGSTFKFEAIISSYTEPHDPSCIYKCIAPHTDLIIKTFSPYFSSYRILDYPQHKGRRILLLEGKLWT